MFTLFLRKYVYQPSLDSFAVIPAMPDHLPQQICDALDGLQLVDQGKGLCFAADVLPDMRHSDHQTTCMQW